MSGPISNDALSESMASLENALLTPLVPGELDRWVETARTAAADLLVEAKSYVKNVLHSQYSLISKTDADILPRVQRMKDEEKSLLADLEVYCSDVDALVQRAAHASIDESKTNEHRARVAAEGSALVLRIKKLQVAATTWLAEAFNRDRGVSG